MTRAAAGDVEKLLPQPHAASLLVTEIYASILGESTFCGIPFVLVRLASGEWIGLVPVAVAAAGAGLGLFPGAVPAAARPFYLAWHCLVACIDAVVTTGSVGSAVTSPTLRGGRWPDAAPPGGARRARRRCGRARP